MKSTASAKNHKATMSDLARVTGLSTMTVSRALSGRGYVSEKTRKQVLAAAKRLDYHLNFLARQLSRDRTFTFGLIVSIRGMVGSRYFGEVVRGMHEVLAGTDYHLALFDSLSENFDDPKKCARLCHERRVDGLVVLAPHGHDHFPQTFVDLKMPLIVVGSSFDRASVSYVDVDNFGGAVNMTQHLIDLGHRRIGFVAGLGDAHDAAERTLAFRKTMAKNNLSAADKSIVIQGDFEARKSFLVSLDLLRKKDRPTAIFAANDEMAYGAIDAARILGLRVPEDVSVAGFDDLETSAEFVPALTTVAQPMMELGRVAARHLIDHLDTPANSPVLHKQLPTQIVIRSSTAVPSSELRLAGREPFTSTIRLN